MANEKRTLTLYFQVGLALGIGSTEGHFAGLRYFAVVQD